MRLRAARSAGDVDLLPFDEVYRLHGGAVYRFCLSQLRRASDAEDVAGEVFASAFAAYLTATPEPEALRAWLIRIARNAVVDHWRAESRRVRLFARLRGLTKEEDELGDVAEQVMQRADAAQLLDCIRALGERDRLIVGLRSAGELSYPEIARMLNLTDHAATVAGRRAFARLRALYEAES